MADAMRAPCLTKFTGSEVKGSRRLRASFKPLPAHATPSAMADPYLMRKEKGGLFEWVCVDINAKTLKKVYKHLKTQKSACNKTPTQKHTPDVWIVTLRQQRHDARALLRCPEL